MEFNLEEAYKLYVNLDNITKAAQQHCADLGISYSEKYRHRLSRAINSGSFQESNQEEYVEDVYDKESEKSNIEPSFNMPSAWDAENNKFLSLEEYCNKYNLPFENVKYGKLVSHNQSHMCYNILFKEEVFSEDNGFTEEFLADIVKKNSTNLNVSIPQAEHSTYTTRVVYTDTHVSMNPNPGGESLYGGVWDKEELFLRRDILVGETIAEAKRHNSNSLIIDDLGDFNDNLNGQTERGGHALEANMSNLEMFEVGVEFKVSMVDKLIASKQFSSVVLHNVCNSNHTALIDSMTNTMVKRILEEKYRGIVFVNNYQNMLFHYGYGDHCFINGHGKNKDTNRFGMKYIPSDKEIKKVDDYIKNNELYSKYKYFHFSKGDSHIANFNFGESDDFDYFSYPALSPSSKYVQENFKRGRSGFYVEHFKDGQRAIKQSPYWFNWKK